MYLNSVTLTGFLGGDAEARTTKSNLNLTVFSLATKNSWRDTENGEWMSRTDWHRCVVIGRLAHLSRYGPSKEFPVRRAAEEKDCSCARVDRMGSRALRVASVEEFRLGCLGQIARKRIYFKFQE